MHSYFETLIYTHAQLVLQLSWYKQAISAISAFCIHHQVWAGHRNVWLVHTIEVYDLIDIYINLSYGLFKNLKLKVIFLDKN